MAATKGIRLDPVLRARFEEYCRANLLDERAVIEAWLLRFLEATEDERKKAASRYLEWGQEIFGQKTAITADALMRHGPVRRRDRRGKE